VQGLSRRGVLRRLGLVAGGVGIGSAPLLATPARAAGSAFTLYGSGLRSVTAGGSSIGSQSLVTGRLSTVAGAAPTGDLVILSTLLTKPSLLTPGVGALQSQTFTLPTGTLVGSGLLHHDGTGTFAVTGGTGAFAGARGSYTVSQQVDTFDGGSAEYAFTLVTGEVAP
jgi:hypothetical protein